MSVNDRARNIWSGFNGDSVSKLIQSQAYMNESPDDTEVLLSLYHLTVAQDNHLCIDFIDSSFCISVFSRAIKDAIKCVRIYNTVDPFLLWQTLKNVKAKGMYLQEVNSALAQLIEIVPNDELEEIERFDLETAVAEYILSGSVSVKRLMNIRNVLHKDCQD